MMCILLSVIAGLAAVIAGGILIELRVIRKIHQARCDYDRANDSLVDATKRATTKLSEQDNIILNHLVPNFSTGISAGKQYPFGS